MSDILGSSRRCQGDINASDCTRAILRQEFSFLFTVFTYGIRYNELLINALTSIDLLIKALRINASEICSYVKIDNTPGCRLGMCRKFS